MRSSFPRGSSAILSRLRSGVRVGDHGIRMRLRALRGRERVRGASCLDNEGALKLADDGGLDADIRPDLDK
jgi:hypothetical protein